MRKRLNSILSVVFFLVLGGCGGDQGQGPSLSLDVSSLNFTAAEGDGYTPPSPQSLSAKINNLDRNVYVGVTWSKNALSNVSKSIGSDTINVSVYPQAPISLGPGDYTDEIVILACADTYCNKHISGSPKRVTVNYTITAATPSINVSQTNFAYDYVYASTNLPQNQTINITGSDIPWTIFADQPWVVLGSSAGSGPSNVSVGVNPEGLAPGTYTSTVTVTENDTNRTITTALTFTITAPVLSLDVANLDFAGINGSTIDPQSANITMNNGDPLTWIATTSADWIVLGAASSTSPSALTIGVDPSITPLASGSYSGTVTVTGTSGGITVSDTLTVSLNLTQAQLSVSSPLVTLGGTYGLDFSNTAITTSLNTGVNTYPWTAVLNSSPNWLLTDKTSDVSVNGDTIVLDANRAGMVEGVHAGSISITTQVNGDTLTTSVQVNLNLSAHELVPSDVGLAFTSTPTTSLLAATIAVSDTYGFVDTAWSASSDQSWLSVTGSGTTADTLSVTADPAGLATDTVHYAVITLTSSDSSIENSPIIRVALWNGLTDPSSVSTAVAYSQVQTDPVRPYAYVHSGGANITVLNIYTGAVVTTWNSIGSTLGAMAISDDGSYLYVVDTANANVAIVNLDSGLVSKTFNVGTSTPLLTFVRPAGHPTLIAGDGQTYDSLTGNALGALTSITGRAVATSADGKNLCALNIGISPWSLTCHVLGYSSLGAGAVISRSSLSRTGSGGGMPTVGSNGRDVAVNADGSRVYVASGAPYNFTVLRGSDLTYISSWVGTHYPNNVETSPNGNLVGAASSWYGPDDLWVYDQTGTELSRTYQSGSGQSILDRQVRISGDSKRIVVLTDDPILKIISMP